VACFKAGLQGPKIILLDVTPFIFCKTICCRTSTMKLETVYTYSTTTLAPAYQTTRCHNPEYFILNTYRCECSYTTQNKPSPYRESFRTSRLLTTTSRRRRKSCDEIVNDLGKTSRPIPEGKICRREDAFIILNRLFKKRGKWFTTRCNEPWVNFQNMYYHN
jgi:hypothetical protein